MTSNTRVTGTQACAACKYQRRKCAPDCILAPYFPHDRQDQFRNAHKLFGVSNITKIIRNLDPSDKDEAMRTIIVQSDARAADPVGGCFRIIRDLQRQIEFNMLELQLVLQQLAICRAHAHAQAQAQAAAAHHHPHMTLQDASATGGAGGGDDSSALNCDGIVNLDPLNTFDPMNYPHLHQQPHEEEYFLHENNQVVPLQDIASWEAQNFVNECHHLKSTTLDICGERLELKFDHEEETNDKSDEAISKDEEAKLREEIAALVSKDDKGIQKEDIIDSGAEDAQNQDLKSTAATLFTLTKCNS